MVVSPISVRREKAIRRNQAPPFKRAAARPSALGLKVIEYFYFPSTFACLNYSKQRSLNFQIPPDGDKAGDDADPDPKKKLIEEN